MVKLTEEMIVARTRVSDMKNVKKLNCWGAELTDITVLRKLVNVEVLSLSVNCISSLADIQNCTNLQELYIRKNKIPDLGEISWLKELSKLKSLWLEENPCVQDHGDLYRATVIRNLPQLQKLDNLPVQSDEMADAMRRGMELLHPLDRESAQPYHNVANNYQPLPSGNIERRRSQSQDPLNNDYQEEPPMVHSGSRRTSTMEQTPSHHPTPSRRISNQVFELSRSSDPLDETEVNSRSYEIESNNRQNAYSGGGMRRGSSQPGPLPQGNAYSDDSGYVPEYHTGRRYSTLESNPLVRRSPHNSQLALNEGMRRLSTQEGPTTIQYEDPQPPSVYERQAPRNSIPAYSGPTSDAQMSSYSYQGGYEQRSQQAVVYENGGSSLNGRDSPPNRRMINSTSASEVAQASEVNHNMLSRSASSSQVIFSNKDMSNLPLSTNSDPEYAQERTTSMVSQSYEQAYEQASQQVESVQSRGSRISAVGRNSFSPERPYPRRPKNRNSNILSAVLCLIKELDGPSLEVAEMAIRCRMDELDD